MYAWWYKCTKENTGEPLYQTVKRLTMAIIAQLCWEIKSQKLGKIITSGDWEWVLLGVSKHIRGKMPALAVYFF